MSKEAKKNVVLKHQPFFNALKGLVKNDKAEKTTKQRTDSRPQAN